MAYNYIRVSMPEDEFARLLELLEGVEDPLVYRLRAKLLQHEGKSLSKAPSKRPVKKKEH